MELTKKERLTLYNQYEILKRLDPDEVEYYNVKQEIVINGFKANYNDLVNGFMDETPVEVSEFVIDVLQMYRTLNNSYIELDEEEKCNIDLYDISFKGFDGNEEIDYYVYARFFLEDLERFDELKESEHYAINSHSNMINRYSRMLSRWEEVRNGRYDSLTLVNIQYIIE